MSECVHDFIGIGKDCFKMVISLPNDAWHGFASEVVWCKAVGEGVVQVLNSPFFAKGISYLDLSVIKVEPDALFFDSVVAKGGHSTYRILLADSTGETEFQDRWAEMAALGCSYESFLGGSVNLYAVDVPIAADINEVYRFLQLGADDGVWDFDEGNYGRS